jgi:hypothetical protein
MYDTENPPRGCFYENLLVLPSKCADEKCDTAVQVLAPKMAHYQSATDLLSEMFQWKIGEDAICKSGHKLRSPAAHLADTSLLHDKEQP